MPNGRGTLLLLLAGLAGGCGTSTSLVSDASQEETSVDGEEADDVPAADEAGEACVDDGGDEDATETDGASCCTELGGPCNAVTQCGCPADQRCVIRLPDGAPPVEECVPSGSIRGWEPCSPAADDCEWGTQCIGWEAPPDGFCLSFCYISADCPVSHPCDERLTGVVGYYLCTSAYASSCAPVSGEGCPSGAACIVRAYPREPRLCAPPGWIAWRRCEPAGTALPGEECAAEPCVVGSGCYDLGDGRSTCYRYCDLLAGWTDCLDLPGTTCTDEFHEAGLVGICAPT